MEIDITGVDPIKFIKEVYNLSVPQGLGFLHFEQGELTDDESRELLKVCEKDKQFYLYMDYIKGRACKMTVFRKEDKLFIRIPWFDHTDIQLKNLLKAVWPKDKPFPKLKREHGVSCNCSNCQNKRR